VLTWRARAALMILLLQAPLLGLLVGLTTRNSMSVPAPAFGCGSADSTVDWCAGVDDRIACEPQRRMAAIRSFGPPAYATVRISDPRTSLLAILLAIFLPIVIVAANALVGERTIYQRERLAGLNIVPYVVARYLVLLLLGAAVAGLHLAVAVPVLGLYGDFGWYFAVALLTASAAAAIGLVLSAAVRTQTAALWGINLLVVPQLLFAGAMAKLDGFRDVASYFTATRWGLEALAKYSLAFRPELQLCQVQRHAQTFAGFGSSLDGVMLRPILGLGAITLACLVAAMWLLKRRDITPG